MTRVTRVLGNSGIIVSSDDIVSLNDASSNNFDACGTQELVRVTRILAVLIENPFQRNIDNLLFRIYCQVCGGDETKRLDIGLRMQQSESFRMHIKEQMPVGYDLRIDLESLKKAKALRGSIVTQLTAIEQFITLHRNPLRVLKADFVREIRQTRVVLS